MCVLLLFAVCCLIVCCLLRVVRCLFLVVCYELCVAHNLLNVDRGLLPNVWCLIFDVVC